MYANLFRGVVTTQFVDRFHFFVPEMEGIEARIIGFYASVQTPLSARQPLTFRRGSLWSTLLGPERRARQQIVVHVSAEQQRVDVEYHIQMILPLRMHYYSRREVQRLASDLGAIRQEASA